MELSHMVMGPAVGVILADLGAEVIKLEPPEGDHTRSLQGSGAGYFSMYNRNKKSLALNLKTARGLQIAKQLIGSSDVLIENFRPGALDKLGLGYSDLVEENSKLIYCSLKGFLPGPYQHRTALDEVTQMMGGLAYMTGVPGKPMRAGSSVIDITGGMFGVIAILSALQQRHHTNRGQHLSSALFETTAFLVGQHMAQQAVSGAEPAPMPVRQSAWAVYDIFDCDDGSKLFVGVVSDGAWKVFCEEFGLIDFLRDESLRKNNDRVLNRAVLLPRIAEVFLSIPKHRLLEKLERAGVPFAPINKPADLFEDQHLNESGGLLAVTLADGSQAKLPACPIAINGERLGLHSNPPEPGRNSLEILTGLGLDVAEQAALVADGVVSAPGAMKHE